VFHCAIEGALFIFTVLHFHFVLKFFPYSVIRLFGSASNKNCFVFPALTALQGLPRFLRGSGSTVCLLPHCPDCDFCDRSDFNDCNHTNQTNHSSDFRTVRLQYIRGCKACKSITERKKNSRRVQFGLSHLFGRGSSSSLCARKKTGKKFITGVNECNSNCHALYRVQFKMSRLFGLCYTVCGLVLCIPREGNNINRKMRAAFLLFPAGD
jgi:hypothetical protein